MKIVIATPLYPPEIGTPAAYVKKLGQHLSSKHEVTIVAYARTVEHAEGVNVITVNKQRPLFVRLFAYTAALLRETSGADIIYVQRAMASGLPALIVGRFRNIPVVLNFIDDEAWERATRLGLTTKPLREFLASTDGNFKSRFFMRVQTFVLRHTSMIVAPSEHVRELLVHAYRIPNEKIVVQYDPPEKAERLPFPVQRIPHRIVTIPRRNTQSGVDNIIRTVASLVKIFPDIELVVVGECSQEMQFASLAKDLGISRHVTFLDNTSRAEAWYVLTSSGVCVISSADEHRPNTAVAAIAAHVPIIAANTPDMCEMIEHEKSGLIIETGNDAELAQAVTKLFTDKVFTSRIVASADTAFTERFSWDAHVQNLNELFASL